MSQNLQNLCCMLIEEFYGEFFASIYSQLARHGRCTVGQLAQQCRLPLRHVKSGLATLIQLRLLQHHTTNDVSTYQINANSTYQVLRCGKLIESVQSRHGRLAAEIIREATILGFTTIAELAERTGCGNPKSNGLHVNGNANSSSSTHPEFEEVLTIIQQLLEDGYLAYVRAAQFQSSFDASQDVQLAMANSGWTASSKGKKAAAEREAKIESEVRKRQSSEYVEHGYNIRSAYNNSADDTSPRKRRKVENRNGSHSVNGQSVTQSLSPSHNALVGISYRNVVTQTRDNYIATMAKKILGNKTAQVLKAALAQLPTRELCLPENTEAWFDAVALQLTLNNESEPESEDYGYHVPKKFYNTNDDDGQTEHYTFHDVRRSLNLLSESGFQFLHNSADDKWRIDKKNLDEFIQNREILSLVGNLLSPPALRIVRMLIENGKMDEKTLQETGLLGAKELRQTLAELKQLGFIDLQEVPREAQRQPNRTIFLWFHDSNRVQKILLENLYKTMVRLLQRLKLERDKLSSTLAKVERSDVRGSEDSILSPPELKVWKRLRKTEEWLLGELDRLDDSVAILRDL